MSISRSLPAGAAACAWLALPATAVANPIDPLQAFPPFPPTLVALLLETLVVTVIVKRTAPALRGWPFALYWYGVNLASTYVLMRQVLLQLAAGDAPSGVETLVFETTVVLGEAAALVYSLRMPWLRRGAGAIFWRRALLASAIGNLASYAALAPIHAAWPDAWMPAPYQLQVG